jgi:HlyD family secretion protein
LERLARDAKAAEARAVRADLELIEAGSRPEDIRSRRAELASARAQEALAKQSLTRVQSLQKSGVASASDLDDAEATHASAVAHRRDVEAQLGRLRRGAREQEISAAQARAEAAEMAVRSADERIARHSLRAGAAATVLDVHLETDEFAAIGMPVVTLADLHHPYVDVFIPQADIDRISLGQSLTVNVDARDESYPAKVEHIARRTEFTPRFLFSPRERPNLVIRVRVRVDAPDGDLPAGVPAFVKP